MNKRSIIKKLLIYGVIITLAAYFMPREKDWTPYFSNAYETPFGNKIIYDNLEDIFPSQKIGTNYSSLYEIKDSLKNDPTNLIIIQNRLELDSLDLDVLIKFVERGNYVFISSLSFPSALMDTLGYELRLDWSTLSSILPDRQTNDTTLHYYANHISKSDSAYHITTEANLRYFAPLDSVKKHNGISWAKEDSLFIFIAESMGKGKIFLHSNPYCFTNYYMLKAHERSYISKAFSLLPNANIIWDEYYNPYNPHANDQDLLKIIRTKTPLAWALYLAISGLILFFLFMSKRKQRIIPILDSFPNESLDLVKTIGELYYNTSDNKTVATKKINHFYTFLNRQIGFDKSKSIAYRKEILGNKTALSEDTIDQIFKLIDNLQAQESVSDGQLRVLQKYLLKVRREFQK